MFRVFKKRDLLSTGEITDIIARAYNQAWWDSAHRNDKRTAVSNKADGLARFMLREADDLKQWRKR